MRIFTTEDFKTYEDKETEIEIRLRINFVCSPTGTANFVFYQGLKIANNHEPVFNESIFQIPISLPLPKGFDLTFYRVRLKKL